MFLVKKLTKKSDDKSSSKPSIPTPLPPRATPAPVNIPVETAPPVVDILESCKRGDLEVMESYLREQGDVERKNKVRSTSTLFSSTLQLGTTLLMLASSYGKTEIVSLLLTHGANVNHQDKVRLQSSRLTLTLSAVCCQYRDTALTIACSSGHGEVVTLLLARGANIHHQDKVRYLSLSLSPSRCAERRATHLSTELASKVITRSSLCSSRQEPGLASALSTMSSPFSLSSLSSYL
jgi:hypothetical protein